MALDTQDMITDDPQARPAAVLRRLIAASANLRQANRELRRAIRHRLAELQAERSRLVRRHHDAPQAGEHTAEALRALYGLTDREIEVARLLAAGRRNSAIADELEISPHTARHHTQRVLAKLGVHSRAEAGARLRR